jgi:hypothetical protein
MTIVETKDMMERTSEKRHRNGVWKEETHIRLLMGYERRLEKATSKDNQTSMDDDVI